MATIVAQDVLSRDAIEGVHHFATGGDVFKVVLSNSAIASSVTSLAGITEITAGGGYSSGGFAVTSSTSAPTTGHGAITFADVTLTASGTINTWRYAMIINTTVSNRAVATFDAGAAVNLTTGNSFLFDFAATAIDYS